MKRVVSLVLVVTGLFLNGGAVVSAQGTVPGGINYQAVARDNSGKEIVNTPIEVQFSILSGSPQGDVVYREVHSTSTSKYGVFSLVIGKGTPVSGTFADIDWSAFNHWLQVSVKFENNFMDMGTMQFMAVPYALYAGKSLEPGPAGPPGPKGDPGDPATDDQQLSFDRNSRDLSISGGNTVRLDTEVSFRAINTTNINTQNEQPVKLIFDDCTTAPNYNIGGNYNTTLGEFKPPTDGIYTFNVSVDLMPYAKVMVKVDDREEVVINSFTSPGRYMGSITLKLASSNTITIWLLQKSGFDLPVISGGYFSGFRVY